MPEAVEPQERMKKMEEAERERAERFPEADASVKAFEEATTQMDAFTAELRNSARELPWARGDAAEKVKDWAGNLIPGVQTAKQVSDWIRINFGGSLKYSAPPYQPTPFSVVRERIIALAAMEKAALELNLTDALRTNQRAVSAAEERLGRAVEGMSLADQLALAELQQTIFELRNQTSD